MPSEPVRSRPRQFPPPAFPPRRSKAFARTPPAIFPVLLGLLGLGLAVRRAMAAVDVPSSAANLLLGMVVGLWAMGVLAYLAKVLRRPGVIIDDMKVLPGRAGLAAMTMGGMAAAAALASFAPALATWLMWGALALHAALAVLLVVMLRRMPAEARAVTPAHHLAFVGFIVAGLPAVTLGESWLAVWLLSATIPVALIIWGASVIQLIRRVPPAPLRPLLAIHLAPACLFATVGIRAGLPVLGLVAACLACLILLALLCSWTWLTEAGFTAIWGALTFPMAAYATAMFAMANTWGAVWMAIGMVWLALTMPATLWIAYRVLKMWPTGLLAARTNAAEA